jgi:hypothetical protein
VALLLWPGAGPVEVEWSEVDHPPFPFQVAMKQT